jgi:hypothetical protein
MLTIKLMKSETPPAFSRPRIAYDQYPIELLAFAPTVYGDR